MLPFRTRSRVHHDWEVMGKLLGVCALGVLTVSSAALGSSCSAADRAPVLGRAPDGTQLNPTLATSAANPRATSGVGQPTNERCGHGPWALRCPEAAWARLVVKKAGCELEGDTGSAIVGRADGVGFYFWAFPRKHGATAHFRADEGYRLVRRVDGVDVYGDGVRLTWQVHGLYVWLEAGSICEQTIDEIVRASAVVRSPEADDDRH